MQSASPSTPTPTEVRAQLARMLSQPDLNASARNRRFLTYVIEETLEGRGCRIKAYSVALGVFDRDQDFDPLIDPIVRIEASRLRRAMEHYYLTAGKDDAVRIDIPKGSYVPTFSYLHAAPPDLSSAPCIDEHDDEALDAAVATTHPAYSRFPTDWRRVVGALTLLILAAAIGWFSAKSGDMRNAAGPASYGPSILVEPFVSANAGGQYDYIAAGLTFDVISSLTRFEELFVYGATTSFEAASGKIAASPGIPDTDYLLSGSVQNNSQIIQLNVILTDRHSGRHVWALNKQWPLTPANLLQATGLISTDIANILGQPDGVLLDEIRRKMMRTPANHLTSYECIVQFRQYWRNSKRDDFLAAESCLHQTLLNDPLYAPAHAAMALIYLDHYRYNIPSPLSPEQLLAEATGLAQRAHDLEPTASRPFLALSLAYWFRHDIDRSIALAEQGLSRNPNNAELLADLGLRYAQLGRWDKSEPLLAEAYQRDPAANSGYHIGQFLHAYMQRDYPRALAEAGKIDVAYAIYGHLARAAAHGQMGDVAGAASAIAEIRRVDPVYAGKVRADLQKRNLAPQIIDALIDGLLKAGFTTDTL
jgi:TolB-like protein